MTRGSRFVMLALGALVSIAATPVAAQMVIGGERPSVDVNWGVLDKLGPEPTLPSLITRKPQQPAKPAASASQGVVYKPFSGKAEAPPKPAAAPKPKKPAAPKVETVAAPAPIPVAVPVKPVPVVAEAKIPEIPGVPPAEKVVASPQPPKPAKAEVVADVPPPPKSAKPEAKAKSIPTALAPVASEPLPVPPPMPVTPAPAKVEAAPSAVQFAKTPDPVPAPPPVPVVAAPPAPPPPAPVVVAAPPPPPPPAPVVQAPVAPPQLAAVAPASVGSIRKGDNVTVLFASESEHLPDSARNDLDKVAQKMAADEGLTLQLLAYAAGDEANASKARRLSLTRALKVRTYLMEMGVRTGRIDVRGLGNKSEGGPADRVDVVLREH